LCRPKAEPPTRPFGLAESPTKSSKLYPVFCLSLTCPPQDVDVTADVRKMSVEFDDWDFVEEFLSDSLDSFLRDFARFGISLFRILL